MVLFRVSTHAQLIAAIIVKTQIIPEEEADLHLNDATDFSKFITTIENTKIFQSVILSEEIEKTLSLKNECSQKGERLPEKIPDLWNLPLKKYTDLYLGHDAIPHKLYFYFLRQNDIIPDIHILDEGMASYQKDIKDVVKRKKDQINHKFYKQHSYLEQIRTLFLYYPELYCVENAVADIKKIPEIDKGIKYILDQIYQNEKQELPNQKYVFFSNSGFEKSFFTNELELLDLISNEVGKENLIIKLHPRFPLDLFSKHGYHVWKDSTEIPWEVFLLNSNLSNHVFLTIYSSAVLTTLSHIHNNNDVSAKGMFLYYLFQGSSRNGILGFSNKLSFTFLEKVEEYFNVEQPLVFVPKRQENLKEQLRFITGIQKREGAVPNETNNV